MADYDFTFSTKKQRQGILNLGLAFVENFNTLYQAVVVEGRTDVSDLLQASAPWEQLTCFSGETTSVCKEMVLAKELPLTPAGCAEAKCPLQRACYFYVPKYVLYAKAQNYLAIGKELENDAQLAVMCSNCDHFSICKGLARQARLIECLEEMKAALEAGVNEIKALI